MEHGFDSRRGHHFPPKYLVFYGAAGTFGGMKHVSDTFSRCLEWLCREEHRERAQQLNRAFTAHPEATGETYWQHLWFTLRMGARFLYALTVLIIHGLFPFLLTREGSKQIEVIYAIMKSRIPKARRDEIDLDYSV